LPAPQLVAQLLVQRQPVSGSLSVFPQPGSEPHGRFGVSPDLDEAYAAVKAAREPEHNRRIAAHEASHALVGRALGSFIELVTIVPNGEFAGRCVRRGAPSTSLNLLDQEKCKEPMRAAPTTADIVIVCAHIGSPEIGSRRVDLCEEIVRAQVFMIELLAGSLGERVIFPDLPPLLAEHDRCEAKALASVVCASPAAIDALLAYAEAEAEALIRANLSAVSALTDALVEKGTLFSEEVDQIIATAADAELLAAEQARRLAWLTRSENAAKFRQDNPVSVGSVGSGGAIHAFPPPPLELFIVIRRERKTA
jgi:hypothetical protein